MKWNKKKIFLIIELIILLVTVLLFIATCKNIDIFNSMTISDYKLSGDSVLYKLNSTGETVVFNFGDGSVKIKDSYKYSSKEEIYEMSKFIRNYFDNQGQKIPRKNSEIIGEITLHNYLYSIGYKRDNTSDADIDYFNDPRWYVNIASMIIWIF